MGNCQTWKDPLAHYGPEKEMAIPLGNRKATKAHVKVHWLVWRMVMTLLTLERVKENVSGDRRSFGRWIFVQSASMRRWSQFLWSPSERTAKKWLEGKGNPKGLSKKNREPHPPPRPSCIPCSFAGLQWVTCAKLFFSAFPPKGNPRAVSQNLSDFPAKSITLLVA